MKLSRWGKDVKIALINRDMTIKQLSEMIGYSQVSTSGVINGTYSRSTYKDIAEKINAVLGTTGWPERVSTPSNEWCKAVKKALIDKDLEMNTMAERLGVSRDELSIVVRGKKKDDRIINELNRELGITIPAIPCDD